jgi:drug/metabolite transporter (DMT)-like permease
MLNKSRLKAEILLALMCIIWGGTFSFVRESLQSTDPQLYLALRFSFALPVSYLLFFRKIKLNCRDTFVKGMLLGVVLYLAFLFQTIGQAYTTATRSGFITALYIVFVPIFLAIWRLKLPSLNVILATLFALAGVGLLSGPEIFGIEPGIGEWLTICCAFLFALQILLAQRLPNKDNTWGLHFWQIFAVVILSWSGWLAFGENRLSFDGQLITSLLFNGILGTVVAFGIQLKYQPQTSAERAAIIYSFEPLFAGLIAYIFLGEQLGLIEIAGGGLILAGLMLSKNDKI